MKVPKKPRIIKAKIGDLKMDPSLIEMRKINEVFVSRYRQAYRAGANMPRIIIIIKKPIKVMYVVSGNHRLAALLREFPDDYQIEVEVRNYASRRELLEDFIRENLPHGNALDSISRKQLSDALMKEGATPEETSRLFNISVKQLEEWQGEKIMIIGKSGGKIARIGRFVKHGFYPKGGELSQEEFSIHKSKDRGINVIVQAGQLTRWLRGSHIKITRTNLEALEELLEALKGFFANLKKQKAS